MPLKAYYTPDIPEAGCDEAGRGCLAGPVFAAAVILPASWDHPWLNDSKQMTARHRQELAVLIQAEALSWAIAQCTPEEIDRINILQASITAMHRAIDQLDPRPAHLLIDGNRFRPYLGLPHTCIVGGDGKYRTIAAASILAKTARDDFMREIHQEYPHYGWDQNMGYPTERHRAALQTYGLSPYHRRTFRCVPL
jgi:ribonuclease HII